MHLTVNCQNLTVNVQGTQNEIEIWVDQAVLKLLMKAVKMLFDP